MRISIKGADAGDFPNARLAWDILKLTANHRRALPTTIDLTECLHLKSYSLACLAAVGAAGSKRIVLGLPDNRSCKEHCIRLGLHEWFQCDEVPTVQARATNIPIRQLQAGGPGSFSNDAVGMWARELGEPLRPGVQRDLENHLDEMIFNALGHSESPVGCFVAGQGHPGAGVVEAAIVDLGITIKTHLTRNPQYAHIQTDLEAIETAMQEGITGTPPGHCNRLNEPNSGVGLTNLFRFCEADQCAISIVSGTACVCFVKGGQRVVQSVHQPFPGTLVNVKFYT